MSSLHGQELLICKSSPIASAQVEFIEMDSDIIRIRVTDTSTIEVGHRGEFMRNNSVKGKRATWGWSKLLAEVIVVEKNGRVLDLTVTGRESGNDGIILLILKVLKENLDSKLSLDTYEYVDLSPITIHEDELKGVGCKCKYYKRGPWHYYDASDRLVKIENYDFSGDLSGQFVQFNETGDTVLTGSYKDDKRNGHWRAYNEKGSLKTSGEFKKGKHVGSHKTFYADGKLQLELVYSYSYEDTYNYSEWYPNGNQRMIYSVDRGDKEGKYQAFYENGQLTHKAMYDNGRLDEVEERFFENGNIQSRANFSHDSRFGKQVEYFENGQIRIDSEYYFDAEVNDYIVYYENGQVSLHGIYGDHFDRGIKMGKWVEFYANGDTKSKGKYDEGQKTGTWLYWSEDGVKRKEKF
jgi:antitoxin component YwqK of YwqJK toxin-antitoxin module